MTTKSNESDESINCPTCAREFESEHGMRIHHTKIHGESLAFVGRECHHCGKTREVYESRRGGSKRFFCDASCRGSWRSEHWVGENHPNWNKSYKSGLNES